jgi:hypothetical protein
MRLLILLLMTCFSFGVYSQKDLKLKKKYLGNYKGTIPSYQLDASPSIIDVSESSIYITITADDIEITIGNRALKGVYEVLFEADSYYLLDATMENQLATERIMVYKRGKHLSRDGMFPQPVVELNKFR